MKFKIVYSFFFSILFFANTSFAIEDPSTVPEDVAITERLGENIDGSILVTKQNGEEVPLSSFLQSGRPLILTPVYFRCPRLCNLTLDGMGAMLSKQTLELSKDFNVLSVSFNPEESHEVADKKANNYYKTLPTPENGQNGWHFLTGKEESIKRLMEQIGFRYKKDKDEYIHASIAVILSPTGKITRYYYGIDFPPEDVRLSLVEASEGKIGTTTDKLLLFCFRFDPTKGKYSLAIMNIVRIVSLGFFFGLAAYLITLKIRESKET